MMAHITNSDCQRIGEIMAIGMVRFTGPEDRGLWRVEISKFIGRDLLLEGDASTAFFIELKKFAERGIKLLVSDGGRIQADDKEEAA